MRLFIPLLLLVLAACHRCPLGLSCDATVSSLDAATQKRLCEWGARRIETAWNAANPVCPNGTWPLQRTVESCVASLAADVGSKETVAEFEKSVQRAIDDPCGLSR